MKNMNLFYIIAKMLGQIVNEEIDNKKHPEKYEEDGTLGSNIMVFIGGIIFIAVGISLLDSNIFFKIIGILMIVFSAFTLIYITKGWILAFIIPIVILIAIGLFLAAIDPSNKSDNTIDQYDFDYNTEYNINEIL
jgi:energy-coupling factor transporter transmembrane protein EcfT